MSICIISHSRSSGTVCWMNTHVLLPSFIHLVRDTLEILRNLVSSFLHMKIKRRQMTFLSWMEMLNRSPLFALTTKMYKVHHSCLLPHFQYLWTSHHSAHLPCCSGTRASFWNGSGLRFFSPVQCWIRANTLDLFLISRLKHSIFHYWVWY